MKDENIVIKYLQYIHEALEVQSEFPYVVWPEDLMDESFLDIFQEFYERNDSRYYHLFKLVADYFDSLDQGFNSSDGKSIDDFKAELINYMDYFKSTLNFS